MSEEITNRLYYGDNLDILRRYIPDESVDLVYLDPPFNSNRDYNVIFKDESGNKSDAQLVAFEDTWHWGPDAEHQYAYLTNTALNEGRVPDSVSTIIDALRHGIGTNQMMAYLVEMAVRLVELHRVLKPTGSLYLHCDPTASHYLKVVLDAIFGPRNFRNEIVWQRTNARSTRGKWPAVHDVILYYSATPDAPFTSLDVPGDPRKLPHTLVTGPDGRKYQSYELTAPGVTREGPSGRPWRGYDPSAMGRHWANTAEVMNTWDAAGLIHWPANGGFPRRRAAEPFDATSRRVVVGDLWTDIDRINQAAKERLGYPTQKPVALLERIIAASSDPGAVVLDPFCGCGTALVAAQKLERCWIGIDVTYLSIAVMKARLRDSFGIENVPVVGQPTEVEGARGLAEGPDGRYQFQWWALGLVDAQPVGGQKKKGADSGIDGVIGFTDAGGKRDRVIVSVKSGHVNASMIRDLKGTLEREKAALGLFVTLEEPSKPMKQEAAEAGFWHSEVWNRDYPRVQIITIRELLEEGRKPYLPAFVHQPYQRAEKVELPNAAEQRSLFES
jgi:site-specific DNA-methyltransferase (adenine-specific)